jgi:hypothetical protein
MVDLEVENTLREIRERVRAEAAARAPVVARTALSAGAEADAAVDPALSRLEANLATAERAWSRLPPLVSYRRGSGARLELWLKRQIKRATHWFTWEQINFNSAAYHALRDTHAALFAIRSEVATLRAELAAHEERLAASLADTVRDLSEGQRAAVAQLRDEQRALVEDLHRDQRALAGDLRREQAATADDLRRWQDGQVAALRDEQRACAAETEGRLAHLFEEQRVLFKQLSLEASERAVAHDRARRELETRLEEIRKAVMSEKTSQQ